MLVSWRKKRDRVLGEEVGELRDRSSSSEEEEMVVRARVWDGLLGGRGRFGRRKRRREGGW